MYLYVVLSLGRSHGNKVREIAREQSPRIRVVWPSNDTVRSSARGRMRQKKNWFVKLCSPDFTNKGRTSFLVRYKVPDILLNCQFLALIHNLVASRFLFARLSFDGGRWGWMAPCLDPLGSSCQWSNRLGPLFRTNQPADWDDILGNSERFRLRTGWKNWIPPAPGGGPWVTPPPSACHRTVGWKTLYGRVLSSVGRPTWRRIKASTTLNLRNESFGMNWIQ